MTARVLVRGHDPAEGLTVALQVTMDLYLRRPADVVLVVPGGATQAVQVLTPLLGPAAARLAEGPQAFAGHSLHVRTPDEVKEAPLANTLVVVHEATPEAVEAVERHVVAAVVVVPAPAADLGPWAARTHADVVQGQG